MWSVVSKPGRVFRCVAVPAACAAVLLSSAGSAAAATPTVTEFSAGITGNNPRGLTAGPDGNLWFVEQGGPSKIGRITPSGVVTEFTTGLTLNSSPSDITNGPDRNLWFAERSVGKIGMITPSGVITEFALSANSTPSDITAGPDGSIWFTEDGNKTIGRISTGGTVTQFPIPDTGTNPGGIVAGPDGNLWFTDYAENEIGRVTTGGVFLPEFSAGVDPGDFPQGIAAGPDGNLWFTVSGQDQIVRMTPTGTVTAFSAGLSAASSPKGITAGPDGNLWFTEQVGGRIGRITPSGSITEFGAGITALSFPYAIVSGPDGNFWFTEDQGKRIGRINTAQDPPAFANPGTINIPAGAGPGIDTGSAGPYPSEINVSGLAGTVTDVRVRLTGLDHTYPGDVDFLLVGPTGQSVLLSSDDTVIRRPPATGVTLNLSDAAPFAMPTANLSAPLISGVFRPTSAGPTTFPAPAPAAPYGSQLSAFDGTAPNGAWKLFVDDAAGGDFGHLRGGWGLDIDTTGPPAEPLTLKLKAKPRQKAGKLSVKATCSAVCDLVGSAKGKAGGEKFKSKRTSGGGIVGKPTKLKLRLAKSALRKVEGEAGKATIKVVATDPAGGRETQSVKVKLK